MKSAILLLSGVSTSVALLVGGLAVVEAALPSDDPHIFKDDKTPLWTSAPVSISDRDNQPYERVAAQLPADTVTVASLPPSSKPDLSRDQENPGLDMMVTAALSDESRSEEGTIAVGYTADHLDWCSNKYRSYRPEDNSYLSYSGMRKDCTSPYGDDMDELAELQRAPWPSEGSVTYYRTSTTGDTSMMVGSAQAQACASRYNSYRASDNSYQPYGGGPRRQCEIRNF